MIAAALSSTGARAGVPDLALDPGLVNRLELNRENFLTSHIRPPITASGGFRKWTGRKCPNLQTYYIIILLNSQDG